MSLLADLGVDIHPAEPTPAPWLVGGVALVAVAIVLPVAVRLLLRALERPARHQPRLLDALRHHHLVQIDRIAAAWHGAALSSADAVRAASLETRTFVGVALDVDADLMTLEEIERRVPLEPRLGEVAALVRRSYPLSFGEAPDGSPDDTAEVLRGFREVIERWH